MSKLPLMENHELHGGILGVGVTVALKISGRPLGESATMGGMVGGLAVAYMKTFGHPEFLRQLIKR